METSYNGWTASASPADFGGIEPLVIAGESFAPGVRKGDVHTVFSHLVTQIHTRVEPVYAPGWHEADDWGFSYRQNRNANNLSCHASGTAIDFNATRHPNGVATAKTFSAAQIAECHKILAELGNLVRWGGDFTGTVDSMHWEIIGTPGQIATLAANLSAPAPAAPAPATPPHPSVSLPPVRSRPLSFQRWYNAYPFKPALLPVISPLANNFGPQSEAALRKVQARYGLVADGIDGPLTKRVLWDLGWRG